MLKKRTPFYTPQIPVKAGAAAPGADKGAGVGPLGSSEHSAPEPASSSGDRLRFEEEPATAESLLFV